MVNFEDLKNGLFPISIVGLGYVGLPIAVAFAEKLKVIGFDINCDKISTYKNGIDPTNEVGNEKLKKTNILFTCDSKELAKSRFHIVAVPTPVNKDHTPDLSPLISASKLIGKNLARGSVVVFESTVYPGVTEEICLPILEKESGMSAGIDFKVAYSPERINPGDMIHRLESIIKVVSGMDVETLELVAHMYSLVVSAGVYKAESIKVAEAAKVIENSQRDINIAFMNELSVIFNKLDIDTNAVLKAASTKWNFLNFKPGLVGGHCIGVDPYYLTYKAEQMGYHSQVILAGRRINDSMGKYIIDNTIKKMLVNGKNVHNSKIAIFGLTFKENCPDTRNTRVIDMIDELKEYGLKPLVYDPIADEKEVEHEYSITLNKLHEINDIDVLIIAVAHEEFYNMGLKEIIKLFGTKKGILIDVKSIFNKNDLEIEDITYWRL